jgi:uncharacterized flavoprotein (TIGR03862 family)
MADPVVVVVGGGPAGLMAAEAMAERGLAVEVFDAMPSLGRKFLMAGKGGLNLTHSESLELFLSRYGAARTALEPHVRAFPPHALRAWAEGLGIGTFVGTSGRVFPTESKAAPLLRAWLRRLRAGGVRTHAGRRWLGWDASGALRFAGHAGATTVAARATVLALGGASWPELGSDAAWVPLLRQRGVEVADFRPANCGFEIKWSDHLRSRAAGQPLKSAAFSFVGTRVTGECVVTDYGLEGGAIYTLSAALRDAIARNGEAVLTIDLIPGSSRAEVAARFSRSRGKRSLATHLKKSLHLGGVKALLLREAAGEGDLADPERAATLIKALPLRLVAPRPIAEAISSAGGVAWSELDERLMLRRLPGVFCTGEMLDWEAPTGGYLLTASLALGRAAGRGVAEWLDAK